MKKLLLSLFCCLMAFASVQAQEVTLDFTNNDWGFPTSKTAQQGTFTNDGYSIVLTVSDPQKDSYYFTNGYLMLGKKGATLELPAFDFEVSEIEVVGEEGASKYVTQNIYVGETAVSESTTGAKETSAFKIDEEYKAAGTSYTLKVENSNNTRITYIKIYKVGSIEQLASPEIISESREFNDGESVEVTISAAEGATIYYTLDGSDPTTDSNIYSTPLAISATTTVKAFAVKDGFRDSSIAEAKYNKVISIKGSVADAIAAYHNNVDGDIITATVTGYIVGVALGTSIKNENDVIFSQEIENVNTNILIADNADETDYTKCIPVQLPSGAVRDELNLVDNKDKYQTQVVLTGRIEAYFKVPGLKNTKIAYNEEEPDSGNEGDNTDTPEGGNGNEGNEGDNTDTPEGGNGNEGNEGDNTDTPEGGSGNEGTEGGNTDTPEGGSGNEGTEGGNTDTPEGGSGNEGNEGDNTENPEGGNTGNEGNEGTEGGNTENPEGGNTGNEGNEGTEGGNTENPEGGNTGNEGNEGTEGGNTENPEGGNTGNEGNEGTEGGNTENPEGGNTGNEGNEGTEGGNTENPEGGNTGNEGNEGDNTDTPEGGNGNEENEGDNNEEEVFTDIEYIEEGVEAFIKGTVVATNTRSFLVEDATGIVLVYVGETPSVATGEEVTVKGVISTYGGLLQFPETAVIAKTGEINDVEYPEPAVMDGAAMDAFLSSPEINYVEYTGTLTISGSYYNIAVEGAATAVGSISYPADSLVTARDGAVIKVTGYTTGISGGKYVSTMAVKIETVIEAPDNDGSEEEPEVDAKEYTVAEAIAAYVDGETIPGFITGYIVGVIDGKNYDEGCVFSNSTTVETNLLIADSAEETDKSRCMPVQLPKGDIRDALNLASHPENYKKQVVLTADITKYFGIAGVKNTSAYEFTGKTNIENVETTDRNEMIFDITGRRVENMTKPGIYIINNKKVLVK